MKKLIVMCSVLTVFAVAGPAWATDNNPDPPEDTFTCPEDTVQIDAKTCVKMTDVDCPDGWDDSAEECTCESGMTADDGSCITDNPDDVEPGDPGDCPDGHHQAGDWCVYDCPPGSHESENGQCSDNDFHDCPACTVWSERYQICDPYDNLGPDCYYNTPPTLPPIPELPQWWVDIICGWTDTCRNTINGLVVVNSGSVDVYMGDLRYQDDPEWGMTHAYHLDVDWGECYRGEVPNNNTCVEVCEVDQNVPCRGSLLFIWNPTE